VAEAATAEATAAAELAAVRESLAQATRTFTERLERGGAELERSRTAAAAAQAPPPARAPRAAPQPPPPFAGARRPAPAVDPHREARAYVEEAKRRADRLIAAANAAVQREVAEVRAAAERDASDRRRRAEESAGTILEDARGVAERIVAERQRRIGALSDGVVGRAEALTAGLEDAARVRAQFDAFARSLAAAADRIARSAA
jgi:hypothetical protein